MEPIPGVILAQIVNFFVLLLIFKYAIGDDVSSAIQDRKDKIAQAENATKVYEETLAKAELEKKEILDSAVSHKENLIQQAELAAKNKSEKIISDAGTRAQSIEKDAQEKASKLESDLKKEFVASVKSATNAVVNKLFGKKVELQKDYVETLAKEYAK